MNLDCYLWHDYDIVKLLCFCLFIVNLPNSATLIMVHIVGHTIELIFTLKIVGLILWMHTNDQPTICNNRGPYCML
jgi:hypothetical protein